MVDRVQDARNDDPQKMELFANSTRPSVLLADVSVLLVWRFPLRAVGSEARAANDQPTQLVPRAAATIKWPSMNPRPTPPAHEIVVVAPDSPERDQLYQACLNVRIDVFVHEQKFPLDVEVE